MKKLEKLFAKLALISAHIGAGLGSAWYAYQPKEPEILNKK